MGKVIRASALILLLACSAQAGWMGNGSPEPPPSQTVSGYQEPTGGELTTSNTTTGETPSDATNVLTQIALDLFPVLPSLL